MCWIGTGTFGKYCCSTTARSSLHKFYLCAIRPNWRKDALEKLCTSSGVQRHLKQDHWSPLRWFCVVDSNSILKCLKHFNWATWLLELSDIAEKARTVELSGMDTREVATCSELTTIKTCVSFKELIDLLTCWIYGELSSFWGKKPSLQKYFSSSWVTARQKQD